MRQTGDGGENDWVTTGRIGVGRNDWRVRTRKGRERTRGTDLRTLALCTAVYFIQNYSSYKTSPYYHIKRLCVHHRHVRVLSIDDLTPGGHEQFLFVFSVEVGSASPWSVRSLSFFNYYHFFFARVQRNFNENAFDLHSFLRFIKDIVVPRIILRDTRFVFHGNTAPRVSYTNKIPLQTGLRYPVRVLKKNHKKK